MPIYEYQCGACGHRLEVIQKMTEALLSECPECGRPSLQKLISAAGFQLKGSGWYATDFKDNGKKKSGSESEAAKTSEATRDDKSTENDKTSSNSVEPKKASES